MTSCSVNPALKHWSLICPDSIHILSPPSLFLIVFFLQVRKIALNATQAVKSALGNPRSALSVKKDSGKALPLNLEIRNMFLLCFFSVIDLPSLGNLVLKAKFSEVHRLPG